ncbi:MAG: hypothetical protein J6Y94_04935, partial [Bacteriovoracaceae bacterium]|nr:hypothetical protein [Bacteriovoracaceae bacterium]
MALCHLSMMRTFRKVSAIWLLIMGMISTIYGVSDTAEAASIYSILNELDKMIQDSASKSTRNIQDSSAQCAQLLIAQKQDDQNKSYKPKETSGAAEDAKLEEVKEILKEVSSPAEQIAPEQLVIDNMAKTIKESSLDQNATLNAITQRIAQLYWSDPITAKQFFAEQIDALFASLIDIILNHGSFAYLDLKNMKIFDEYDPRAVHPFVTLQILSWSFFRLNVDSELDRLINNGVINFLKYFLDQDIMLDGEQQTTISAISEQLAKHKSITSPHQQQIITDVYRKWAAQDGEHYFVQKEIARDFSYLVDPATQKYAPFFNKLANQEEVEEFIAAKPKNTSFYINHVAQTVKSHQDNLTYPRTRNLIHRQYAVDLSRFVSLNDLQSDDYFQILSNIEHPELIFVDKYFISAQLPYLFENPAFPPAFGKALQNISSSNIWPVRGTGQDYTNYAQAWEKNLRDYFDPFVGVFQEVDRLAHRHHPEMDRGLPPEYWPAYQELLNFIHHKIDPSSSEMALADQELVAQGESMVDQIASWSNLPPVEADTLSSKMNGSAKRELGDSDILLAPNEDLANHPLPGARWYLETLHTLAHLANPQDSESLFVFYNILNKLGSNTSLGLKALELNTESLSILHDLYPAVKRQGS